MKFTFEANPILKWAGGKQALAEHLIRYVPDSFNTYYEPFIGGASVLLTLQPERAIIGGRNDWLLDTYGNLEVVARCLRRVQIRYGDFELSLADVTADDFVYRNPPYYKQGGFADFDRYTNYKFRESDHVRLAAVCRELDERGVRWAVSNSDSPLLWFAIYSRDISCSLSRIGGKST